MKKIQIHVQQDSKQMLGKVLIGAMLFSVVLISTSCTNKEIQGQEINLKDLNTSIEETQSSSYTWNDITEKIEMSENEQVTESTSFIESLGISEESTIPETIEVIPTTYGKEIDWSAIQQQAQTMADSLISNSALSLDSLQFAIMDGGLLQISGQSGQYDRQQSQALSVNSMYCIGSVSKIMAVTAVLQLCEQGKVNLDDSITKYLPELSMKDSRYQDITVRMLMNHSSGLQGNTSAYAWRLGAFADNSMQENFINLLNCQNLKSTPGDYGVYCNDGFTLLELICEEVSGLSYSEYLHQFIFDPLQMEHTYTPADYFDTKELVKTYFGSYQTALPAVTIDAGFGGIYSTAEDLCKFGQVFTSMGTDILKDTSVAAMANAEYKDGIWYQEGASTTNYGLGWDSVDLYPFAEMGIKAVTKNGDVVVSGSQLIVLPEYNLVAAVTGSGASTSVGEQFLIKLLLDILQQKELINEIPQTPTLIAVEEAIPEEIQKFAGTYVRTSGTFQISFSGNQMIKTTLADGSILSYTYMGNGHFTDGSITDIWFVEQNGKQYQAARTWLPAYDLISLPSVTFQGVRTEISSLSDKVKLAWQQRNGKTYLLVSEPADSMGYMYSAFGLALPSYKVTVGMNLESSDFWRGMRIVDENCAVNVAEVPISGSTNAIDAEFIIKDNREYLKFSNGITYVSADNLPILNGQEEIQVSAEAVWYRTESSIQLQFDIPEDGAIAVYDSTLMNKDFTTVSGTDSVMTQEGGYIVFIGSGTFHIQ